VLPSLCRTCEVKKVEMSNIHFASECTLRDETEHRERITSLENVSGPTRVFWSKEWGINGNTILAGVPGFQITKQFLHDPMHDILEGVARYELRAMLRMFIVTKKFFTLHELNSRINNFEYTPAEAKDKPQALDARSLDTGSTLGQSAASMKVLMTLLPCLISDKIPHSDPY